MANWKTETRQYVPRLNELRELLDAEPPHPASIPRGPLDAAPTALQSVLHQAVLFYEVGVWLRSRETIIGILILWKEGCISAAVSLMRILFELWAASEYQTAALEKFESTGDLESSARTIGRLFEGVVSPDVRRFPRDLNNLLRPRGWREKEALDPTPFAPGDVDKLIIEYHRMKKGNGSKE